VEGATHNKDFDQQLFACQFWNLNLFQDAHLLAEVRRDIPTPLETSFCAKVDKAT
jgi:hypothetical protein